MMTAARKLPVLLILLLLLQACAGGATAPARAPATTQLNTMEVRLSTLLRQHRQGMGLSDVATQPALVQAARGHSQYMLETGVLSHTGRAGSSFDERARAAGYAGFALGENVAEGYRTAEAVFSGWLSSPGHRDNMQDPRATESGVGMARDPADGTIWWTMVMGSSQP